jgi:LysM repeat protein
MKFSPRALIFPALIALTLIGCKPENPPGPTAIPTQTLTQTPTLSASLTPVPTLLPVFTATRIVGPTVVYVAPTDIPTLAPASYVAKAGDTVISILVHFNLPMSAEDEFLRINNMTSTAIQVGVTYLIPRPTPTPTREGDEKTRTAQAAVVTGIPATAVFILAKYTIVKGDDISSVMIKTGASLRQLCDLNSAASDNPNPLVCGSECKLDAPVGQLGCRVTIREGGWLYYPGPTPTPTTTPTISGSETATLTPTYAPPRILSPIDGAAISGIGQISWISVGVLQPDEVYLIILTDAAHPEKTIERETRLNAIPYPPELAPTDGQPHTINWQIGIARKASDGSHYVIISPMSLIYRFIWQPNAG